MHKGSLSIDMVRAAIKGHDEIVEIVKDGYTVFDYLVQTPTTFAPDGRDIVVDYDYCIPSEVIRRECRGLVFMDNGSISRPFHKFHNVGENEASQAHNIDWNRPFTVFEKEDGSMIRPLYFSDHFRLGTRKGITDVAMKAETFVAKNPEIYKWIKHFDRNMTPIFEYVGPSNKIVLNYIEEDLILLAVRYNYTGEYMVDVDNLGVPYPGTVVQSTPHFDNIHDFMDNSRVEQDCEGYVIAFDDGDRYKIKNDWYVNLHGVYDAIRFPHKIAQLGRANMLDDILAKLEGSDKHDVGMEWLAFRDAVVKFITLTCQQSFQLCELFETKKEFALSEGFSKLPSLVRSVVFARMDKKEHLPILNAYVDKQIKKADTYKNFMTRWENEQ